MVGRVEKIIGKEKLILETGKVAKQANGSVWVQYGGTVVLVTSCGKEMSPGEMMDFFPLTVEYRGRTYAGGKIPGGFFKREGRPLENEIITSRLIDRPLRPLFPEGLPMEVQIIATALSVDEVNDPDILGIIGASASLAISDIPFSTEIGAARIGYVDGKFIINPTHEDREKSIIDLVVSGGKEGVSMVEGNCREVSEDIVLEAIEIGSKVCGEVAEMIGEMKEKYGKEKRNIGLIKVPDELLAKVEKEAGDKIRESNLIKEKKEAKVKIDETKKELISSLSSDYEEYLIQKAFSIVEKKEVRKEVIEGKRLDGRAPEEIRPISCEVGVLPRTHGSALFTRGETQALVVVTLGSKEDEQTMEKLWGDEITKTFMLHYNFPPFSVGEIRPMRGPGRREIGHGHLAEKALKPVIPEWESFPYTIRLVSDILESNGSSSMATVCGGSLALMDAGVPTKRPVAGIAMGLVKEDDKEVILTDIFGLEDKYGDMDLKIAGTSQGITAIQMDIKVNGLNLELLRKSFLRSKEARGKILEIMEDAISSPRKEVSQYAPHIAVIEISQDKIGSLIGPGGKNIRKIISDTGAKIFVDDAIGRVTIESKDKNALDKAIKSVRASTQKVEVGGIYTGKVARITPFGAFVELFPGTEGLLHVSQIDNEYVEDVRKFFKEGDEVKVKVISIDERGRINLSRKELLNQPH